MSTAYKWEIATLSLAVRPAGESIIGEHVTVITLQSEGGGAFVELEQCGARESGKIGITPEEWPVMRKAIDTMIAAAEREPQ